MPLLRLAKQQHPDQQRARPFTRLWSYTRAVPHLGLALKNLVETRPKYRQGMERSAQTHRGEHTLERRSGALRVALEDPGPLRPRRPTPMLVEGGSEFFEFIETDANFLDSRLLWQPPVWMSPILPGPQRPRPLPAGPSRPTSLYGPAISQGSLAEPLFHLPAAAFGPGPQHCSTLRHP